MRALRTITTIIAGLCTGLGFGLCTGLGFGLGIAAQSAPETLLQLPRIDASLDRHAATDRRAGIAVVAALSDGSSYVRTVGYLDDEKRFPLHDKAPLPLGELTMELAFHGLWLPQSRERSIDAWRVPLSTRIAAQRVRDAKVLDLTLKDLFGFYSKLPPYFELAHSPFPASRRDEVLRTLAFAPAHGFEGRELAAALLEAWVESSFERPAREWLTDVAPELGVEGFLLPGRPTDAGANGPSLRHENQLRIHGQAPLHGSIDLARNGWAPARGIKPFLIRLAKASAIVEAKVNATDIYDSSETAERNQPPRPMRHWRQGVEWVPSHRDIPHNSYPIARATACTLDQFQLPDGRSAVLWTFHTHPEDDWTRAVAKHLLDDLVGFRPAPKPRVLLGAGPLGRRQLRWRTALRLNEKRHRVELRGWIGRKWRIRWLDGEPPGWNQDGGWNLERKKYGAQLTLRHPEHPIYRVYLWGSDEQPGAVITRTTSANEAAFAPIKRLADPLPIEVVKY